MPKHFSSHTVRHTLHSDSSSFLPSNAPSGPMRPEQFVRYYTDLHRIIAAAQNDLRRLLHDRGWTAHRPGDGPLALYVKVFPDNREFRVSEGQALRVEESYCTALTCFET